MAKKSRTQKLIKNILSNATNEIVAIVCGLILPKLVLRTFGSSYNGITQSITQFISYISLMQAGVGGATLVALYKPLSEKNDEELSEIIYQTSRFMRKIALIFVGFVIVLSIVYPIFIVKDFGWWFSASLIFIISISTFAQYFFGYTYQLLVSADQKEYIVTRLQMLTTILNTIVAVILINSGCGIHIVKLGAACVSVITPLYLNIYVKKHYSINKNVHPKTDRIAQKWDAAIHELSTFVYSNCSIVMLTFFSGIVEVSVYTVYNYVISNMKKIVTMFTTGFRNAFGDMYIKNERELMVANMAVYELIIYSLTTIMCGVAIVMIIPFVTLYTKGVTDANYIRPTFAIVDILACAFNCYRMPYRTLVYATGQYKETKKDTLIVVILNIVLSAILAKYFGLVGVALSSLIIMIIRSFQLALYLSENVLYRNISEYFKHVGLSILTMALLYFISKVYMNNINTWISWIIYAILTTLICVVMTIAIDYIFYKNETTNFIKKLFANIKIKLIKQ